MKFTSIFFTASAQLYLSFMTNLGKNEQKI